MQPNKSFQLDINDIEIIERALFLLQQNSDKNLDKTKVVGVRAKLHHQKNWFRPKKNYVGG